MPSPSTVLVWIYFELHNSKNIKEMGGLKVEFHYQVFSVILYRKKILKHWSNFDQKILLRGLYSITDSTAQDLLKTLLLLPRQKYFPRPSWFTSEFKSFWRSIQTSKQLFFKTKQKFRKILSWYCNGWKIRYNFDLNERVN